MHRKQMLSKKWGLTTQPFAMNYIKIVTLFKLSTSYSIMAEGVGSVVGSRNGSFQSQITRRLPRKASRAAMSAWKPLCVKKSPRGDPRAGAAVKRSVQQASKFVLMSTTKRRTAAAIAKSAAKELQSLAEFMPNLADTDARTLALRLYCIE